LSDVNLGAEVQAREMTWTHVCDTQENERDICLAKRLVTSRGAHKLLSLSALILCPDLEFRLLGSGENRDGRRRARRPLLV
jgi:hypothetical protein